jgi:hypothetical protein
LFLNLCKNYFYIGRVFLFWYFEINKHTEMQKLKNGLRFVPTTSPWIRVAFWNLSQRPVCCRWSHSCYDLAMPTLLQFIVLESVRTKTTRQYRIYFGELQSSYFQIHQSSWTEVKWFCFSHYSTSCCVIQILPAYTYSTYVFHHHIRQFCEHSSNYLWLKLYSKIPLKW